MIADRKIESAGAEFHADMDIDVYHGFAKQQIWSKTNLKELVPPNGCPALFRHKYLDGGEHDTTSYQNIGKAVHTLALEPELFEESYYILPEGIVRNAKHAKFQEHLEAAGEKTIIREQEMADIRGMAYALTKNPFALSLLDAPGTIEGSIFWTDEETGLKLRCRPDFMREDGLIVDLKTTNSVRPDLFKKHAFDLAYDMSVALTSRGYEALHGKRPDNYVLLLIETKAPYMVAAFDTFRAYGTDLSYLDGGELRLQQAMRLLRDCQADDYWPSYCDEIRPMEYPAYAMKFLDHEQEGE